MLSLNDINLNEDTDLCLIMRKNGSDKNRLNCHNYTKIYDNLFKSIRYDNLNVFEVGLGTYNPNIPSSMAKLGVENGRPGASMYGWREYFTNSNIYGADIDMDILFNSERIKTYFVDQLKPNVIQNMWHNIDIDFDIIIDDGLHTFEANTTFLENSFHKLKKGGFYIIEDVSRYILPKFEQYLGKSNFSYQILDIPLKGNTGDNILILIRKN